MASPRQRHALLACLVSAVALGAALPGCGSEGVDTKPTTPVETVTQQVCADAVDGKIATVELDMGLTGGSMTFAADRVRVRLSAEALGRVAELEASLADAGMCLADVDKLDGSATVHLVPSVTLDEALGHLATVAGIERTDLDAIMHGTGGDDDDDDGNGSCDNDDDGCGDDDDGNSKGDDDDDSCDNDDDGCGNGGDDDDDSDDDGGDDDDDSDDDGGDDDDEGDDDDDSDDDDSDDDGGSSFEGPSVWHPAALRLGPALDNQSNAAGITVAVLDTGLKAGAPGLESLSVASGHDFINNDSDPTDDDGHGTMLTGILASDGDFPGVAPKVTVMPVKVLDDARTGTESALADGIDFAVANGADIISMSLAFPPGYIPSYELSQSIYAAAEAGVILVGAAGNHGTGEVGYPAAFGEVIAVSGGRMADNFKSISAEDAFQVNGKNFAKKVAKADYSGWGAGVDVMAPGGSPDHDLDGDTFPDGIPVVGFTTTDPTFAGYIMSGTSPATVQVSGLAALLLAGGATSADVRPLLYGTSNDVGPDGFDIFAGAGVADAKDAVKKLVKNQIPAAPKVFANPIVTIAESPSGERHGVSMVEIIDENNDPIADARVVGHFRGDVAHAVEATTDEQGRVFMVSNAAPAAAQLFEFGVDKVIVDGTIAVPGTFARFEANTFFFFSAFEPGGAGVQPTPFMIFMPTDVLSPIVSDFRLSSVPGSTQVPDPVSTIPANFDQFTLTESLLVRSFGTAGSNAPTVFAIERSVLQFGCAVAEAGVPIPSTGGGVQPTPFKIGEDVLGIPPGFDDIVSRSDGGLFYNGNPTDETQLGLLTGTTGTILIGADGSLCVPQTRQVNNLDLFAQSIQDGNMVSSYGIQYTGSADAVQSGPAPLSLGNTALSQAVAQGIVSSASLGASTQASAAVQP